MWKDLIPLPKELRAAELEDKFHICITRVARWLLSQAIHSLVALLFIVWHGLCISKGNTKMKVCFLSYHSPIWMFPVRWFYPKWWFRDPDFLSPVVPLSSTCGENGNVWSTHPIRPHAKSNFHRWQQQKNNSRNQMQIHLPQREEVGFDSSRVS